MKAILEIELIGDNIVQEMRMWTRLGNDLIPGSGSATFGSCPPSGWVAEITGFDLQYKYARTFLKFKKDYSRANSKGSRGVYAEYILEEEKIYDVKDSKQRYFCKVDNWQIVLINESEVREWLKNHSK
ncbi:MAG: hypothetical protein GXY86_15850 [Firmicutes bacterium]|nr:hypothetical protein [Bacillota bacterium]